MRLNLQSDYALRVLTHLDVRRGELVTIKEIADRFRISEPFDEGRLLAWKGRVH